MQAQSRSSIRHQPAPQKGNEIVRVTRGRSLAVRHGRNILGLRNPKENEIWMHSDKNLKGY
jgi:hypothetical protein